MFIELRHLILRHMLGVYAGKIVLNLIELRHYFSRRFQVLRVAKNPLKLSKSAKSVSANAENCVTAQLSENIKPTRKLVCTIIYHIFNTCVYRVFQRKFKTNEIV